MRSNRSSLARTIPLASDHYNSAFNSLFGELFEDFARPARQSSQDLNTPLDVFESEEAYEVIAELPGIDKDLVEISWHENILSIKGQKESEERDDSWKSQYIERRFGTIQRQVKLAKDVDFANSEATFTNGVLKITLPKSPESKPKTLKIKAD